MESHGYPMCIHATAATRDLLGDDDTGWADYGRRDIKGASSPRFSLSLSSSLSPATAAATSGRAAP